MAMGKGLHGIITITTFPMTKSPQHLASEECN